MGKRRNRKNRRRKKQHVWQQFRTQSFRQTFEDETEREQYKDEHKKHLKNIAGIKLDILSRTVMVGSVLPLHVEKNRVALMVFLEQSYGPVQKVEIVKKGGKFPLGRVTFNFKNDAEKLFGGKPLAIATRERQMQKISCSVGYKGSITVRPSFEYKGMMEDESNANSIVVNTQGLVLGHWFPQGSDACINLPGFEGNDIGQDQPSTWVEENVSVMTPILKFQMDEAVIELDVTSSVMGELEETISMLMMSQQRTIISFRFKDLAHSMQLCSYRGKFYIIFALKHPPRLSSIVTNLETGWETRTRLTEIGNGSSALVGIGDCLGYKLEVSSVETNRLFQANTFGKLKTMGLFRCEEELVLPQQAAVVISHCKADTEVKQELNAMIASLPQRLGLLLRSILDSNSCSWFDMLSDRGGEAKSQSLFDLVIDGENDLVERVLSEIRDMHGKTRYPAQLFHALYEADVEVNEISRPAPQFCVTLPRILISPCRIAVSGFEVEMSNRLVRKFIEQFDFSEDAFIRASIGDENGDKLFSDDISSPVEERVKSLVLNEEGIIVGAKPYYFLAYSSSQLKEQSIWMVSPEYGWSVQRMRRSMGDFSICTTPAKFAARIGQCFSTTIDTSFAEIKGDSHEGIMGRARKALGLHNRGNTKPRVKDDLPDIISRNSSTGADMEHSDGVGIIRKELLLNIAKEIPFGPRNKKDISAVQIRYGGAKGVLVAWDFRKLKDQSCAGYDICLRPSMVKFKAPYDSLEVVTIANRIPYFLNRNVILLGSHKGIPDRVFMKMQERHIDKLNNMLTDADVATKFLPQLSGPDNGLIVTLRHMLYANLKPDLDPFLFSCLHCTRSHHLMGLRKKARIHVEDGAVLIGGIDELGLIPENCVFLQVPRPASSQTNASQEGNEFMVVKGRVMVTKHPGDMRMLHAVDIPELRGHKNVILFSQRGERPEADKMSGSDLDGDQFAITWDKRLFLNNTSEPMDYSPPLKKQEESINDESLLAHFINHARNDNLGRIAMLWMDHAVIEKDAGCAKCLELAKLASIAVDFPKSGVPAVIPDNLILKSSTPRAHWRELKGKRSFHCQSAVGQLYDKAIYEISQSGTTHLQCTAMAGRYRGKDGQILHLGDARQISMSKESIYDPMLVRRLGWRGGDLDDLLVDYAENQRFSYEDQLLELMSQYKIKSEGEVATGCILKYHKLHKRRRHDISEQVRRQFRSICKTFRSEFITAVYHLVKGNTAFFGHATDDETDDEAENEVSEESLEWIEAAATGAVNSAGEEMNHKVKALSCRLAAAYYITTYMPEMHVGDSRFVLYSFPWVVAADVIARGVGGDLY